MARSVEAQRGFVDQIAEGSSNVELEAMRQATLNGNLNEFMFWDSAYNSQQCPV